jgi:hypothetical protein
MRLLLEESRPISRRPLSLALILVAAAAVPIFVLFLGVGGSGSTPAEPTGVIPSRDSIAAAAAVSSFSTFAAGTLAADAVSPDHSYTADGIRKLARVVEAVALRLPDLGSDGTTLGADLRDHADRLQADPRASNHAEIARSAFVATAEAISEIQTARYPALERAAGELRDAATMIRPNRRLLSQAVAIQRFFDRASDVLRGMAEVGL